MSVADNKHLPHQFIDRFTANDIAGALDLMTDDATWWIAGKPDQLPASGVYSKEQIARLLHNMIGQLLNGLRITVKSLVCEGDKVAMEAREKWAGLQPGVSLPVNDP
jgi:ketosteroid isomerase-like protein